MDFKLKWSFHAPSIAWLLRIVINHIPDRRSTRNVTNTDGGFLRCSIASGEIFSKFKMFVTLKVILIRRFKYLGYLSGISKFSKNSCLSFFRRIKWFSKGESQFSIKITHHPNSYFTRKRIFACSEWPRIYFFSRTISRTHFHRTFLSEPKNFLSHQNLSRTKNKF